MGSAQDRRRSSYGALQSSHVSLYMNGSPFAMGRRARLQGTYWLTKASGHGPDWSRRLSVLPTSLASWAFEFPNLFGLYAPTPSIR